MSKLSLAAARSGVYRASAVTGLLAAAKARGLRVARVACPGRGGKPALLRAFAAALEFPDWFGGNWDALEDCLTDLGWSTAPGHLILIEGAEALADGDFAVLREILGAAAQFWSERRQPFYAVFLAGPDSLPELGGAAKA